MVWAAIKNPIAASPASTMVELGNKIQEAKDAVPESVWLGAWKHALEWEGKYWEHVDDLDSSGSKLEGNFDEESELEDGTESDVDDGEEI